MKKVTTTYYVCQYCGYKDTDDASMRKHESVCKKKIDAEDLIGKWIQISEYRYFKITELKPISDYAIGIEMGPNTLMYNNYRIGDIINKPVSSGYLKFWNEWKKRIEE